MTSVLDMKLKLLGGFSIKSSGYGDIEPLTLGEIVDFGYERYLGCLNIINVSIEDLIGTDVAEGVEIPHILDLLIAIGGEDVEKQLETSLSLFLRAEAVIDKDNLQVIVRKTGKNKKEDVRVVNRDNYDEIKKIIRYQNYVDSLDEKSDNFNPANEEARRLKERMEELKKKREKAKGKNGEDSDSEGLDIYDIISALASKSYALDENTIFNLTVYQLYSKYKRIEMIDQYEVGIKSALAGASDVKIKHWTGKID